MTTVQPDPTPGRVIGGDPPRYPDPGHPLRAADVSAVVRKRVA